VFSLIPVSIAKGRLCALTTSSTSQILILYKPADGDWRQNASSKLTWNDFVQRFLRASDQLSLLEVYFQLMKNERCVDPRPSAASGIRKWKGGNGERQTPPLFFFSLHVFSFLSLKID